MTSTALDDSGDNKFEGLTIIGEVYYTGLDDCLDTILSMLAESKSLDEIKLKVEHMQVLVKDKKFENLRRDLGVIGKKPF
jgi:hypothetical protein